jgi:hypothetical protein
MITESNTTLVSIRVTKEKGFAQTSHEVVIKVYKDGDQFLAIPCLEDGQRRFLNLPIAFNFRLMDQCIIPSKGSREEYVDMMKQIVMGIAV